MTRFDAAAAARMERMYGSPEIVAQRARTRKLLAIKPGERGLEVGCGIGLLACEMARDVGPAGNITALDSSADMVAAARSRAEREALSDRIRFVIGDATRLDFAPASFDFVVAVQVYLYVKEIERALAEAARVLRPGARLVIVDTDWDSCVWLTGDRERHRRVLEARTREFVHPHLPPLLPGLLRAAGLDFASVDALPVLNLRYDPESFSGALIDVMAKIASKHGIEPAEARAWADDLKSRTGECAYFFSVNRYLFLARRA
jgi:arsenite methyltransferase